MTQSKHNRTVNREDGKDKVEQGPIVNFDQSNVSADSSNTSGNSTKYTHQPYEEDNMMMLCGYTYGKIVPLSEFSPLSKSLMPYIVNTRESSDGDDTVYYQPSKDISSQLFKTHIEKCETYGQELAKSGIYDLIGLNKMDTVKFTHIVKYFKELKELDEKTAKFTKNPFIYILSLDVKDRPFLAGAVNMFCQQEGIANSFDERYYGGFFTPLGIQDIMAYAKQVNEMDNLAHYIQSYVQPKKRK